MIPFAFWEGLAIGLASAAVVSALVWWYLSRRLRGGASPRSRGVDPVGAARPSIATRTVPTATASLLAAAPAAPTAAAPATGGAFVARAMPAEPATVASNPSVNGGQLRISRRVLFHIASVGRVSTDEVAPRSLSQAGMVESLGINQGALTGVLRRFVAAGVLEVRREHVRGAERRLKVYRLTSSGERLVQELRSPPASRGPQGPGR